MLLNNVGGMHFDSGAHFMNAGWRRITKNKVLLPGTGGEVLRSFFGDRSPKELDHHDRIDSRALANALSFPADDPAVLDFLEEWIGDFPREWSAYIYDIAYWELRLGIRFAIGFCLRDAICNQVPLINSRELFQIGLRTPLDAKSAPYPLFRRLIELGDTKLLKWDFNLDWMDRFDAFGDKFRVPWRMKKWAIKQYTLIDARIHDLAG